MTDQQNPVQLTFDVGGTPPNTAVVTLSGRPFCHRELAKGEEVHLQLVDADGQIVADGYGRVIGVAFKDKLDKDSGDVVSVERVHSIRVT